MFEICEKVAFVTGGASGIGLATVEQLLMNGIRGVTIADINEERGKEIVDKLDAKYGGGKLLFLKVDVANRHEFKDAFTRTIAFFHNLDIVINAAGIMKELCWEEEIAVNLGGTATGTYFAFEEFLPKNKTGCEGVIINFSSITALKVYPYCPIYSGTKSGVMQLSRCFGLPSHYQRNPVRVMVVCPGHTDTTMLKPHHEKYLSPAFGQIEDQIRTKVLIQSSEHVAEAVMSIIKEGSNGSVWLVQNGEAKQEITFPDVL